MRHKSSYNVTPYNNLNFPGTSLTVSWVSWPSFLNNINGYNISSYSNVTQLSTVNNYILNTFNTSGNITFNNSISSITANVLIVGGGGIGGAGNNNTLNGGGGGGGGEYKNINYTFNFSTKYDISVINNANTVVSYNNITVFSAEKGDDGGAGGDQGAIGSNGSNGPCGGGGGGNGSSASSGGAGGNGTKGGKGLNAGKPSFEELWSLDKDVVIRVNSGNEEWVIRFWR